MNNLLICVVDISVPEFRMKRRKSIKPVNFELSSNDLQYLIQNYSNSKKRTKSINRVAMSIITKKKSDPPTKDENSPLLNTKNRKSKFQK